MQRCFVDGKGSRCYSSGVDCVVLNSRVNWKGNRHCLIEVLAWNLPGGSEENCERPQSG
jgi:hypothetical protein